MNTRSELIADPSNAAMAEAWDGNEGAFWTANADHFDRGMENAALPFFEAAAIRADDEVLDVGCGFGRTTCDAARIAADGSALGVDLSSQMLALARKIAADEGLTNIAFEHADAQIYPFADAAFDIAISRFGSMFFGDPVAAFTNLHRALRSDGRLTLLTWQPLAENEWLREFRAAVAVVRPELPLPSPDAPSPFALSDPDRVRGILEAAGFAELSFEDLRVPMRYGRDADDAFNFISGFFAWVRTDLGDSENKRLDDAFHSMIAAHTADGRVTFDSASWIIHARKP
jgi:SAM-dependent methyltransferase